MPARDKGKENLAVTIFSGFDFLGVGASHKEGKRLVK
jgi:hypothetical protein